MFGLLDQHFTSVDNATISEASIFGTEKDKQRYETLLMYSFRKLKAAQYHSDNVRDFILKDLEQWRQVAKAANIRIDK